MLLQPEDIKAPWSDHDKAELCALIAKARAEGKWLAIKSMMVGPLWLSPLALTEEIRAGRFCYSAVNWMLADPEDRTRQLDQARLMAQTVYVNHLAEIEREKYHAAT